MMEDKTVTFEFTLPLTYNIEINSGEIKDIEVMVRTTDSSDPVELIKDEHFNFALHESQQSGTVQITNLPGNLSSEARNIKVTVILV